MKLSISIVLLLGCSLISAADQTGELAVIVNKTAPFGGVNSADLRLMIMGEKSKWPDGKPVIALQTPPDSPEGVSLFKSVYKMSEAALKRYYMLEVFNGKEIAQAREVASAAALKKFVASTPGAIGCVFASEADDTVKVLKVDGAAPGEPGYRLR